MSTESVLGRFVDALERAGIPHMLTGSFASSYYGTPRGTQDIDLVITATRAQIRALVAGFRPPHYYADEQAALAALDEHGQFNVLDLDSGMKVDLIVRKPRPFSEEEFARRRPAEIEGVPVTVATAEDVVIAKLEWAKLGASSRQIDDAASILRVRAAQIDLPYVERWVRELGLQREWEAAAQTAGVSPRDRIS